MFEIIKRTSGFWHLFNNNSKEVNISSFDIVLDSVAQTYILQCKNGANVPNIEVPIANIIVRDETGANVDETFATVALLLARLIALSYTPYLNITGLTNDQLQAIQNANAPTGVNPFATMSDVGGGNLTIRPTQTGTTYTLVLADSNSLIPFSSTSNKTVTIPTNATVAFGIGDRIYLQAINTNNVTFTVAGAVGVTLTDPLGLVGNGGSAFILTKLATDSWLVEAMPFIALGGSGNTLYTTKAVHGDGGFITSQDIFILAGRGLSDFGGTQKFGLNAGGYYGANVPLRYDSALSLSNALELVNLGFINTIQTIGDANATILASTTRAITSVDLTANRTWTLPSSGVIAGKTITIQDAHQTVGIAAFKIIIAVGSGKTLNGITDGTVFLDKIGQAITFYCDGSGNYTYENIVIPTLQEVLDNNHDLIDEVFSVGSGAGYDNVGRHVNSLGGGAGFENGFSYVNLLGENASADENGQTVLSKDGAIMARISTDLLTDTRKYTLQDSNGTIAHLSDIPSVDATPTDGSSNAVSSNGVFDALALKLNSASPSYTGLITGVGATQTGTSAIGVLDLAQTWNTTGNPIALKLNVTNTASGASANLMDLQVGGVSQFKVSKAGVVTTTQVVVTTLSGIGSLTYSGTVFATTSGNVDLLTINRPFSPTSGTGTTNAITYNATINQTGGASGITRGLYINPTLTSAADFRAIEVVNGSVVLPYRAETANYAIKTSDYLINITSGIVTATLPTAVGCTGKHYIIKNTGASVVTVATTSSQTIDGVTTATLGVVNKYIHVVSTGTNWIVIANN
jgi:hypothetical protein